MAKLGFLTIALFVVLQLTYAADSPAPAPSLGEDSSPQLGPTPVSGSPDSPPAVSPVTHASPPAPMAPSPSDLGQGFFLPESSPAPSPEENLESSPAPSPEDASDINHSNINADVGDENTGGGGGMSGGKKAGIVVGVVVAAGLVGVVGMVYKKRQDNIRRSQYGNAARTELL